MKQSLILWIAAAIITFLAGYAQSISSPDYPLNGTVDLVTGSSSFRFEKTYAGKDGYKIIIASDFKGLTGKLNWRSDSAGAAWHTIQMEPDGDALIAVIPHHPPLSKVVYNVKVTDKGKTFVFPEEGLASTEFLGNVPSQISMFYFLTLFAGLILAVRTGLEVFQNRPRLRLYTIFTLISFFSFTLVFSTVKKGCELGAIGGTKILSVADVFSPGLVLLLLLWIAALILVFNTKKPKLWASVSSILTLIIFLAARF